MATEKLTRDGKFAPFGGASIFLENHKYRYVTMEDGYEELRNDRLPLFGELEKTVARLKEHLAPFGFVAVRPGTFHVTAADGLCIDDLITEETKKYRWIFQGLPRHTPMLQERMRPLVEAFGGVGMLKRELLLRFDKLHCFGKAVVALLVPADDSSKAVQSELGERREALNAKRRELLGEVARHPFTPHITLGYAQYSYLENSQPGLEESVKKLNLENAPKPTLALDRCCEGYFLSMDAYYRATPVSRALADIESSLPGPDVREAVQRIADAAADVVRERVFDHFLQRAAEREGQVDYDHADQLYDGRAEMHHEEWGEEVLFSIEMLRLLGDSSRVSKLKELQQQLQGFLGLSSPWFRTHYEKLEDVILDLDGARIPSEGSP